MRFQNPENHFAFKLLVLMFFLGTSSYLLIFNYFDVPKISEQRDFIFGVTNYNYPFAKDFVWDISFNDKMISNFENIIILIFMLWGFMKLIDLAYFLVKYKKEETIKISLGEK